MLIALALFYFVVTGIACVSILGNRHDTGLMLALLFVTGFAVIPAAVIVRALR